MLGGCGGGGDAGDGPDADADTDVDTDADGDNGVSGDERCPACDDPPSCGGSEVLSCCVCVAVPTEEIVRTSCDQLVDDEFCGEGDPDLTCFDTDPIPGKVVSRTMAGTLDVFGNGVEPDGVLIDVHEEIDGTMGALLGSGTADVAGCGDALGEDVACCVANIEAGLEEDACPEGGCACVERDPDNPDEARLLAYYEVSAPIDTNVPLVVKTSGDTGFWKELYSYNVVNEDGETREIGGETVSWYEARVLSVDDYESIPAVAGVGRIESGRGVLAGEIHDCGDVRLSFVQVSTQPDPPGDLGVLYFNGNDEDPLPVASRTEGTCPLGLYASMNIEAGPTYVSAVGLWQGERVSLGWYQVEVFGDSVTAVTLRGLMPHQVQ